MNYFESTVDPPESRVQKKVSGIQGQLSAVLLVGLVLGFACATPSQPGTAMHPSCRELPTVEECRAAAAQITDECLRGCINLQCAGVQVNCGEYVRKECNKKSMPGNIVLGYAQRGAATTCDNPAKNVFWCEEPASRGCRANAMVHELAHSCGWAHGEGLGVPGNDGALQCE